MDTITEPISATSISGAEIVDHLCSQIADKLSRSGDLRPTDAYRSYSARVTIDLQLADVDHVEIADEIVIGTPHPEQPSKQIVVAVPEKRYYTPRNRAHT
jgi:hypothetical protein